MAMKQPKKIRDGGIDAGLMLLELATPRGVTRSVAEIAFVCGCTESNIYWIEKNALKKLRRAFQRRGLRRMQELK